MTSPIIQKDIVTACKIKTIKVILEELNSDYFALLVAEFFDISRKDALSLKEAIVNLLAQHSLSPSSVRGQCVNGLKMLIRQEDSQKATIEEALDLGELPTGRGLNQQIGLSRACDTRWGSHYKSFNNFILTFDSILEESYASSLRSRRRLAHFIVLHDYCVEVFCSINDWQLQELNDHFNEVATDLLHEIACLNPINLFLRF
ncbi:hypothetical protein H5410_056022 [Solanum commersonii]|uniref:Uncharacterized protein n=1 Tax=Solanum commersonii TaxID=4109 RepID=A0A9J5WLH6_SOLCO|nr:hypothetical protein H5410_056022 [Solanum commersonii]